MRRDSIHGIDGEGSDFSGRLRCPMAGEVAGHLSFLPLGNNPVDQCGYSHGFFAPLGVLDHQLSVRTLWPYVR